jgi:CRISPR/Cas system-associated exonuclease Cas4 (RecB family)
LLGEVETPILLEGRRLHERDAKKALRKFGPTRKAKVATLEDAMLLSYANVVHALKKRKVITNSEKKKLFISIIPEHGILGFPDFVDCRNGQWPVIVEEKNCKRIPTSPWPDHIIQVTAYTMSLHILGFSSPYAVLEYVTRDKARTRKPFQVPINDEIKRRTVHISRSVVSILKGQEPRPTTNPNQCLPCAYVSRCKWSPLHRDAGLCKPTGMR